MKLTNTLKHTAYGLVAGIVLALAARWIGSIDRLALDLGWFFVFAFFAVTLNWEYRGYEISKIKLSTYWNFYLCDSLVDVAVANVAFLLPMLLFGAIHII